MSATFIKNFKPLASTQLASRDLMRALGELGVRRIRTRTERGVDANGRPFQPLSPEYAAQKTKHLGHARADLTVSGRMLNDMGVGDLTETSASISFRSTGGGSSRGTFIQRSRSMGAADKAFFHQVTGAGKAHVRREFFDLSETDIDHLQAAVLKHLDTVF